MSRKGLLVPTFACDRAVTCPCCISRKPAAGAGALTAVALAPGDARTWRVLLSLPLPLRDDVTVAFAGVLLVMLPEVPLRGAVAGTLLENGAGPALDRLRGAVAGAVAVSNLLLLPPRPFRGAPVDLPDVLGRGLVAIARGGDICSKTGALPR